METAPAIAPLAAPQAAPRRIRILGEAVDLVTPTDVLSFTARTVAGRRKALVLNHNTHSLHLCRRHPEMRALYGRADLVEADSTPLILWGRITGKPISARHRCTYLDWRAEFWRIAAANRWRVFYLGGAPGVAEAAAKALRTRWPGAEIMTSHGYFDMTPDGPHNRYRIEAINNFRPDVIFVGMGMPRQEAWIAANYDALASGVVFSVGAAFDYEAGAQRPAPRWLGPLGLEWLFRLAVDPRRLFTRYLVEPWSLMGAALQDLAAAFGRGAPPADSPDAAVPTR